MVRRFSVYNDGEIEETADGDFVHYEDYDNQERYASGCLDEAFRQRDEAMTKLKSYEDGHSVELERTKGQRDSYQIRLAQAVRKLDALTTWLENHQGLDVNDLLSKLINP